MLYPWVREANKIFLGVLVAQFVLGLVIAWFTSSWTIAVGLGLAIMVLPVFLILKFPDARLTRLIVGISVQLFAALHIQQSFGLIEMHFEIFSLLAFLVFYRDWLVIAISTLVVAVHHILFFIMQSNGVPVFVFEEGHVTLSIVLIHALFAVIEAAVLMYIASKQHASGMSAHLLITTVDKILENPERLNLTVELDLQRQEMAAFNQFVISIRDLIEKTRTVGTAVNTVSEHVSHLATSLQQSLSDTSNQVDTIASSSEQMSATIAHVATNASNVNDIATQTKTLSSNAKSTVESSNKDVTDLSRDLSETANTINSLSEKTDRISQVMEAIKVVSEQTNLLALNAAIESARAGDHGRGFAVVADEVRQLAIKTRESVEEITEVSQALITDGKASVTQMQQCLKSAEKAMNATRDACDLIDEVYAGITQVQSSISEVASSTDEQSSASSAIAASSQNLYDLSQQETASATETLSEVDKLRELSLELEKQLSRFHV